MNDLIIGIIIIGFLSTGMLYLGFRIDRRLSKITATWVCIASIASIIFWGRVVMDTVFLAKLMPFSNLIILGNLILPMTAFFIGVAWNRMTGNRWRKFIFVIPMVAVAIHFSYGFFWEEKPWTTDRWSNGVCLQSAESSCSAAAGATLLTYYNIPATEKEMVDLCLTSTKGTWRYGLYRGLKIKTVGTEWKPEVIEWNLEQLRSCNEPVILMVKLVDSPDVDPRYKEKWGWTPGVIHAVVCYDIKEDGRVEIGDPTVGREFWDLDAIKVLWHGQGVRLVKK